MARQRSEEARLKVLASVGDVIIERGVEGLTIEEVAQRSGVAKSTIYRRWPERASLIIDTVQSVFAHVVAPDTGSLRGDLDAYFELMTAADLSGRVGRLMPSLTASAARDPEISAALDRLADERERPVRIIMERAVARGELPDDLDFDVVMGTVIGPIVFHKMIRRASVTPGYAAGCLDVALRGLGARRPASP
ncbi:MAG: TetR/AcrR family transcriptional regulator [Acidimicrobiales bacterium]